MEQVALWIGVIAAILTAAYNFLAQRGIEADVKALQSVPAIEAEAVPGSKEVR